MDKRLAGPALLLVALAVAEFSFVALCGQSFWCSYTTLSKHGAVVSSPHLHAVRLNGNRQVTGTLRGFDQFMNLVLDATVDDKLKVDIGMVVSAGLLADAIFCAGCLRAPCTRR